MGKFQDLTGQKFNRLTVLGQAERRRGLVTWECKCECGNITYVSTSDLKSGNTKSCGCIHPNKFQDITGQRFGRLVALKYVGKNSKGKSMWKCQCDCGAIIEAMISDLRSGNTKSCGCLQKERTSSASLKDLTGKKFGRLTVIKRHKNKKRGEAKWICKCECGNEVIVAGSDLRNGNTKSCGCLQKERASLTSLKDLTGKKFGRLTVIKRVNDYISPSGQHLTQWLCKCECGNEIKVTTTNLVTMHTQSCGCIKSKGEETISNILNASNIAFTGQKTYDDLKDKLPLRFDFYIIKDNYLIEFDGEQHYTSRQHGWSTEECLKKNQRRDKIKNEYCIKNKIPLIRISLYSLKGFMYRRFKTRNK